MAQFKKPKDTPADKAPESTAQAPAHADDIEKLTASSGKGLILNLKLRNILEKTPGGTELDRHFGITSGKPEQTKEHVAATKRFLDALLASDKRTPLILDENISGADPDALRALMKKPKK